MWSCEWQELEVLAFLKRAEFVPGADASVTAERVVLRLVAVGFIVLALTGCAAPRAGELIGTYQAGFPSGSKTLELRPDGTYAQTAKHKSGTILKTTGKWTYPFSSPNILELDDALSVDFEAPNAPIASKCNWALKVSKQFSTIKLHFDDDGGHFKKIR